MSAPAHHQIRIGHRTQNVSVTQDVEYRVGDAIGAAKIKIRGIVDLVTDIDNVAQNGEQVLPDTLYHAAIHEGAGWRTPELQFDATLFLNDSDVEGMVAFQQFLAIIHITATVEHRQRTVAKQRV